MVPPVTVAALAVADGPTDAVGVVQLACDEDALALTLLRAGAYREGFVPGTLATSVTLRIPYGAVRGLVRRGRALVLTLDRSVPSPFHRFALARFTDDPAETLAPLHRAHRLAGRLAWALPGPLGALAATLAPGDLVGGALGRASLALLVALVSGTGMRGVAAWLAWGGPVSDRHREAFEAALAERLGLLPRRAGDGAKALPGRAPARTPALAARDVRQAHPRAVEPADRSGEAAAGAVPVSVQGAPADPARERALDELHRSLDELRRGLNDQHRGLDALQRALGVLDLPASSAPPALPEAAHFALHEGSSPPDAADSPPRAPELGAGGRDTLHDVGDLSPGVREIGAGARDTLSEVGGPSLGVREIGAGARDTLSEVGLGARDTIPDVVRGGAPTIVFSADEPPLEVGLGARDTIPEVVRGGAPTIVFSADEPPEGAFVGAGAVEPSGDPAAAPGALDSPSGAVGRPRERRASPGSPPHIELAVRGAPRVPWARLVGLAAVVAVGAVSAAVFVKRFGTTGAAPAPEIDDTVSAFRAEIPPPPPPPPPPPREERCFCDRADSPLWRDGVPVLTVLTTTGPDGTVTPPAPKLDEHDQPVFNYDLAVVNNGAVALREVRVVLTYARRDAQDNRVAVTDRGLYWGKPLGAGRAVKWTTDGPGTEVRIDKSEAGTLEERGVEPAPADAFFALTRARHRVVRLHSAMMLAYLRDARAGEALASIGAPLPVEGWTVRRIRAAMSPVIACDVTAAEGRLSACVFNGSTKAGGGLVLSEIQDDEGQPARSWPIGVEVPVHDGVKLAWPLEGDPPGDLVVRETP